MEKNYWLTNMGKGNMYADIAYENGFIAIGWNELGINLDKYSSLDKKDFFEKINPFTAKVFKDQNQNSRSQTIGQLFRFSNLMKIGDIILMRKADEGKLYIGVIDSNYFYEEKISDECPYHHRRKVRWITITELTLISQKLRNSIGSIMTVFSISDHAEEIESLIQDKTVISEKEELENFALEAHLEEFLVENWNKLDLGKKYEILKEDGEVVGKQYPTKIGKIDILARSKDGKEWLVVELKKFKTSDDVVGQVQRYMGWVKMNETKNGEKVKGLIITPEKDEKLIYSLLVTKDIDFMTYKIDFKLRSEKIEIN